MKLYAVCILVVIIPTCHNSQSAITLQLDCVAYYRFTKTIILEIQMLQRLVDTKDITKGLGTSSAHSTI